MSNEQKTMAEQIEEIRRAANEHASGWLAGMQELGAVERRVRDTLDRRAELLVCQLLGFDSDTWGGNATWKLDHCNGRAGNSAAGDWLRSRAVDAVKDWLDEQAGQLPELSKAAKDDLRNEYSRVLRYETSRLLRKRAEADAAAMLDEIVKSATGGAA